MATPTLAKSPESHPQYDGKLIEDLIRTVEKVQKPKPPQPAPAPAKNDDPREQNARMLSALWEQGEKMAAQAIELRGKPDPLLVALNGFPDVHTYYADAAGR